MEDLLTRVAVEGEEALVLSDHVEELIGTPPSRSVRLLAGHDQWVLGPGSADRHVVPPTQRPEVTRGANLVLVGGVLRGTWRIQTGTVAVSPWADSDLPQDLLAPEVARVSAISSRR